MATILERIQYGFDRDSRRTWRRRALATGEDYHYGYDGLSQVISSNRGNLNLNCSAIAAVPGVAESWEYDPTGNWHGYKVDSDGAVTLEQDRVHDKGNRLTQIKGEAKTFLLDRVGRMTQAAPDAIGDWEDALQFRWDAWNRIKEVRLASDGSLLAEYSYDGLHRRITREVGGVVHHTYYSEQWKPLEERKDSASTASVQYLWGSRHRDDLVRRDRDSDDGGTLDETRYVLMDYYSPASITDEDGEVVERYDFSAFGMRRILQPDFSPRATSECDFEFAFQGQFIDVESGLLDYGYRYYSPYLGRWLCKDPIAEWGDVNLYAYVGNHAVNVVDLFGLSPFDPDRQRERDRIRELCEEARNRRREEEMRRLKEMNKKMREKMEKDLDKRFPPEPSPPYNPPPIPMPPPEPPPSNPPPIPLPVPPPMRIPDSPNIPPMPGLPPRSPEPIPPAPLPGDTTQPPPTPRPRQ